MHEYLMFALALSPLLLMVFLILKLKMPIHYSVLISLVFTAALSAIFWEMPTQNLKAAIGYGALKGLWPIVIVILGAIFSYNVMQATKALDILRDILASISEDKRIQVLLISWCFGGFLEAAAGYGTAVAIPIGILIALGFNPLKAAIASLVANTVPTAFGAVGIPVSILAEQVNLPVYTLGGTIILQLALFNILLPFVIVCIIGGGLKAIRGVFLITLICGISTLVPQYFVAIHLGAELPAFAGSLVSLFAVAMVSRLRKGKTDPEWRIEVSHTRETTPRSAKVLFRVGSIYLFIFVFILLCSPLFPTIKGAASQLASVLHFTLADGTRVWLNSSSQLTFPTRFTGMAREVTVKGEVYFEVQRDEDKPFIVWINDVSVRVLGTKFCVSAYPENEGIVTTLVQGAVQVTSGDNQVVLKPGYQAVVDQNSGAIKQRAVELSLYTSWVQGVFEYENMKLNDIMVQLARWYDVQFTFSAPEYKERRFTGVVRKYEDLNDVLDMIEKTTNVKFIMNGRNVTITSVIR